MNDTTHIVLTTATGRGLQAGPPTTVRASALRVRTQLRAGGDAEFKYVPIRRYFN